MIFSDVLSFRYPFYTSVFGGEVVESKHSRGGFRGDGLGVHPPLVKPNMTKMKKIVNNLVEKRQNLWASN